MKFMIKHIVNLGRNKTVALITIFSICLSLIITAFATFIIDASQQIVYITSVIAIVVPLIIAPIVGLVLVNSLLKIHAMEQEMRELATIDDLTKLLSRRAWLQQARKYIRLAKRTDSLYSVLMIDLDNFKSINDRYGHTAGDKVLIKFGETLNQLCRASDFSARFGGEEFIILLPDTSLQQTQQFTDRLHKVIREIVVIHEANQITFTISIGVSSQCNTEHCNIDTLISQSDSALYHAKQQGKNCTYIFQSNSK